MLWKVKKNYLEVIYRSVLNTLTYSYGPQA